VNADAVPILTYHSVCDGDGEAIEPYRTGVEAFESHAEVMEASSRRWVTVAELGSRLAAGHSVRGLAAVTFDDPFADTVAHAVPSLSRRGIPSTVYAVSRSLGEAPPILPGSVADHAQPRCRRHRRAARWSGLAVGTGARPAGDSGLAHRAESAAQDAPMMATTCRVVRDPGSDWWSVADTDDESVGEHHPGWMRAMASLGRPGLDPTVVRYVIDDLRNAGLLCVLVRPEPRQALMWDAVAPSDVVRVPRRAHVLDLPSDPDELLAGFSKNGRRDVRRAERSGVEIRLDRDGELIPYYLAMRELSLKRWAETSRVPFAGPRTIRAV
jgi:hypothetical protein